MPKVSPINTIYAWRLLADYLCSPVKKRRNDHICNPSFSPISLHVSASALAAGSSDPPAEPSTVAARLRSRLLSFLGSNRRLASPAELRSRLLSFLRSNSLGRLPDNAASSAVTAATAPSHGDGFGVFFETALWLELHLFVGPHKLYREAARYDSLLHPADFENDKPRWDDIRKYPMDDVRRVLRRFDAAEVYGGPGGMVEQLKELKGCFEEQTLYHFYSASVMVIYEEGKGRLRVKMVDFTHVVDGEDVIDHNFLGGD